MFHKFIFDVLDSTNDYLKEEYNKYENKSVIIALRQTNGRGRFNRSWTSFDDLTFSVMFKNDSHLHQIIAPLAIIYALKEVKVDAMIKWPNDIYIDGKKLSGILIENVYKGKKCECIIVGIGINMDPKIDVNACGVREYAKIHKEEFLDMVLSRYDLLLNMEEKDLLYLYERYNIVINKQIMYQNKLYVVKGINKKGHLKVSNNEGEKTISSQEIDIKQSLVDKVL